MLFIMKKKNSLNKVYKWTLENKCRNLLKCLQKWNLIKELFKYWTCISVFQFLLFKRPNRSSRRVLASRPTKLHPDMSRCDYNNLRQTEISSFTSSSTAANTCDKVWNTIYCQQFFGKADITNFDLPKPYK